MRTSICTRCYSSETPTSRMQTAGAIYAVTGIVGALVLGALSWGVGRAALAAQGLYGDGAASFDPSIYVVLTGGWLVFWLVAAFNATDKVCRRCRGNLVPVATPRAREIRRVLAEQEEPVVDRERSASDVHTGE